MSGSNYRARAEPPQRRTTIQSNITFDSLRRRGTTDTINSLRGNRSGGPFQEHYSCYEGLTWEALRGYLEKRWPGRTFREQRELDDWVFEVPERLSDQDRINIAALRDENRAQRRRSQTPE